MACSVSLICPWIFRFPPFKFLNLFLRGRTDARFPTVWALFSWRYPGEQEMAMIVRIYHGFSPHFHARPF